MPYVSGAPAPQRGADIPGLTSQAVTASSATATATNAAGATDSDKPASSSRSLMVRRKGGSQIIVPRGETSNGLPPVSRRVAVVPASSTSVTRRALPMPRQGVRRARASLTDTQQSDELGSWLSSAIKGIGHAATQVGHTVGKVVTSKVGQGILGGALALTGVGLPAAAGIFAATKGVGNLIKPGGNLKSAATGAAQGAVEGVVSSGVGSLGRSAVSLIKGRPSVASAATPTTPVLGTTAAVSARPSVAGTVANVSAQALPVVLTPSAPAVPTVPGPVVATLPGTLPLNPITPPSAIGTAVRTASQSGAIPGYAGKVLQAGKTGSNAASKGAADAKMAAAALAAAAQIAAQSGQTGLAGSIANIAGQVASVGSTLQTASGAIQGAATGAVAGAQTSQITQWIDAHKGIVYGGLAGVGLLTALAVLRPRHA